MLLLRNEYDYLKHNGEVEGIPTNIETETLYSASEESILLVTAEKSPGRWVHGYVINFNNGRRSERKPGELSVWFKSREDARLYFLGYILQYREYFGGECIREIKSKVLKAITKDLFL